ncbi:hypothetical protein JHW43_001897 [Diplocarpon mali]|nr:hypothetical protein JHW43_001897 [Diplocarpon mali]
MPTQYGGVSASTTALSREVLVHGRIPWPDLPRDGRRGLVYPVEGRPLPGLMVKALVRIENPPQTASGSLDGKDVKTTYKADEPVHHEPSSETATNIETAAVTMLGKKRGPAVVLPILMFCYGSFTILSVAAKTFGGMMALRCFLGISEPDSCPWVIQYLTTFYRRSGLARRLAIFYAARNIANAFSRLLVSGVFQISSSFRGVAIPPPGVLLQSVSLFLPHIVARPFITLGFIFTFCGVIIYATIDFLHYTKIAYFATFMICRGTSAPSVLLSTWFNNNTPHEDRRVVLTSVGVPLANVIGLVSSNIFTPESAPKNITIRLRRLLSALLELLSRAL